MKLDFSATNFTAKVTGWRLSIEKKTKTLFPAVCNTARGIAGVVAATVDSTQLDYEDPQILARANLASEDEDSAAEHEKDKTQVTERHNNADHDSKVDDSDTGSNSGVDEDDGNGGVDANYGNHLDNGKDHVSDSGVEDYNNGGDDSDGLSYTDKTEVLYEEDSILTDIISSSVEELES